MAVEFDVDSVQLSQVLEGIAALVVAPVILPLSSAMKQPLVKSAIREGLAFSERCQEAVAHAQENVEDIFAEIQAEVEASYEQNQSPDGDTSRVQPMRQHQRQQQGHSRYWDEKYDTTQTAVQIQDMMYELNTQISWLTRDTLDLRMLMAMGLGALALRQLIVRGIRLDEIPWYVFAWYALDTFVKFHPGIFSPGEEPEPNHTITVEPSPDPSPQH